METGIASRTARATAAHRAVHQILDGGRVFLDPLAVGILGENVDDLLLESRQDPHAARLRLFIACRSRFAEDALSRALATGVRQVVILGAGLDTLAYRPSVASAARIFEADHPDTQLWKRARVAAAGIVPPAVLRYVPIDFEGPTWWDRFEADGLDRQLPTFFTWLGVVPYLDAAAIATALDWIGHFPGGAELVLDYSDPPDSLEPEARRVHEARAARVAALGEVWRSHFDEEAMAQLLRSQGFAGCLDLGPSEIGACYLGRPAHEGSRRGGHIVHAWTAARAGAANLVPPVAPAVRAEPDPGA